MAPFTRYPLPALWAAALLCTAVASAPVSAEAVEPLPEQVEFNRDIRPILSDTCFHCHGPDKNKRKANLRLDVEEEAFADRDGRRALVPGDPFRSELFLRVTAGEESERMPPVRAARKLTERQIAMLRRWIEQGAKWQKHWSFIPPQSSPLPTVKTLDWTRNAIDRFVLARLEHEGLGPAPEADPTTLIRRVTLDLTGLSPTPADVDAFLADRSPSAYERLVDRLLHSPRYGERMARPWLDAARYADTNGYQSDGDRTMWRWRDWVIDAFNKNMPFDQFTIEQLAGDMLPGASLEQKIATGFNRNHRGNAEGGIIPEEYAAEYVVDRVDTTATVWLGLTMGCARCHDHKYDPITQKEFYRVFAFFNNVPERGKAIKFGNSPPMIKSPTSWQQTQRCQLDQELAAADRNFAGTATERAGAQAKWENSLKELPPVDWSSSNGLALRLELDSSAKSHSFRDGEPAYVPGRIGRAADFDGQRYLDAGDVADFGYLDKFSLAAWMYATGERGGTLLSRMTDANRGVEGYSVSLEDGKLHVRLIKRWLDDAIRVETERRLPPDCWHHVMVTYDGSRLASGVRVYVNGQPEKLRVLLDDLNQTFRTKEPFRVGAAGGPEDRFHGHIDDVRIYAGALSADESAVVATTSSVTDIAAIPVARRNKGQALKITACFLEEHAPLTIREAHRHLVALRRQREQLIESFPTTMVMEELATPRDTHVLIRGEYDKRGETVTAGTPAFLPPLPAAGKHDRLAFARWLVDATNPLSARVVTNRYWQVYLGAGLVRTVEDFGTQGEWPSHPELLDWLATEFTRGGWDVKALQRLIVTSATYRQSSHVTPSLLQKDPENRLLGRGPRFRLSAELVRDQALAASGLLVERGGGPSVKPYQPAGLVKELTGAEDYQQDHGQNLYRRSLYTFWKRTVAPPLMMTFDAGGRETCVVRETRTNTPLQALNLMNDVTYVEAARMLAERVMIAAGPTPEERLTLAFRLVVARQPSPVEMRVLLDGFRHHLAGYRADWQEALKLLRVGEHPRNETLDVAELAAYTAVAGLILNLDEAITKG